MPMQMFIPPLFDSQLISGDCTKEANVGLYMAVTSKQAASLSPSFTDWVQNVPRRAVFLNNSRWYRITILPIVMFVHFSPTLLRVNVHVHTGELGVLPVA
jgi:hypothetical protein